MNAAPPKILFIGLDAADKDLMNLWAGQGLLPTWSKLLAGGLTGITESPIGFYVGAIWPSFYTAVNPARHGHHCWEQMQPASYEVRRYIAGANVTHEAFWEPLGRAGLRTAVVDVPLSGPARSLNGLQVIEWGCHDPDMGFVTVPPTLAAEIEGQLGLHPIQGNCNQHDRTANDFVSFRDELVRGVALKTALNENILAREPWDMFLTIYSESHCVGHQCWHLHDPDHPRYDLRVVERVGDPVRDVYVALDRAVGRLLERAGSDATVVVWASHGMGGHYDGTFMINEILLRMDVAHRFASGEWKLTLRERLSRKRGELRAQELRQTLDTPRRRFFPHPNNREESGIRINLMGREAQGLVRPGPEYDRLCVQLAYDLRALVDVKSGRPIVRRVLRTREHYDGEYIDHLPDLIVQWHDDFPVRSARSPLIGDIEGECPSCRTGGHRPIGQFIAMGPGIKPGRMERRVNVMDFAPTLARLLGVHLDGVDGKAIPEIAGD